MRLEFQKNIASSQFTLPFVSTLVILLWFILPTAHGGETYHLQHGLWPLIPDNFLVGTTGRFVALALGALGVYLVAELTNANVLLRISSRMLSSTLAVLLGAILCLHLPTPGHIVMICSILTFFTMFSTYQAPSPVSSLITYMILSMGAMIFPKLIYLVPFYWCLQAYLRALSLRCIVASVLGILLPYWLLFLYMFFQEDGAIAFVYLCHQFVEFELPDYSSLHLTDILIFAFVLVFFLSGMINFYINSFRDKTRTRIIFNTIIAHAFVSILFLALQPQFFHTLLPLLVVDSALVGGHFIALTYNKFSHIYCIVMLICIVALVAAQIIL